MGKSKADMQDMKEAAASAPMVLWTGDLPDGICGRVVEVTDSGERCIVVEIAELDATDQRRWIGASRSLAIEILEEAVMHIARELRAFAAIAAAKAPTPLKYDR